MSSGFSYPRPIFTSPIYNPAFYLTLDASGYLTYEYAQTLYLDKNDYRLTYITALVPGINNDISGIGALSCSSLTVNGSTVSSPPSYVVGVVPGTAANNKALVLDGSGAIGTISSLTANNIYGSIKTGSQPNITSVGTLSSLIVSASNSTTNGSLMSDYALSLVNPYSINGNQVGLCFGISGNLPSLYSGGASIVHQRSDTNSMGLLRFNIRNSPAASDPLVEAFRINADASTTFNYPMTIDSNLVFSASARTISGLSSISATTLTGTLSTAAQTNITSVGSLNGLTIDGNLLFSGVARTISGLSSISATTLTGALSTAAQTAITSVGALNGLTIDGNLLFSGVARTISGLSSISATTLTGAVSGAQTGITAVGILSNLTLSTGGTGLQLPNLKFYNSTTVSYDNFNHAYYLSVVEGGCVASKALVVD